jgi:hypothetical protein
MDESLLRYVYDRYKPRMDNPNVLAVVTGGGSSVYYYVITAVNETGETDGCKITVTGAPDSLGYTQYITLNWDSVLYAKKYRVYGRLAGSAFGLMTETEETSFIDYGVLVPDATKSPPEENTTGRYNWENIVFLPGRSLQSAELNEIQSVLYEKIRSLGGAFFQNGDIVAGCDISWTGNGVKISSGKVYAWGTVRDIDGGELAIPFLGTWYVGLNVREVYIDSEDDSALLDPAQGYPGYAQAGAARRLLYFYWTWATRKDDIDIPMWEIIDGSVNSVRPVYEYSVLDRTIARKLHSLHGFVWVSGYATRVNPDQYDRDKIRIAVAPGVAFVNGKEIRKSGEVRLRESVAKDLSDEMLEEVSPLSGYLYKLMSSPVAKVLQVEIRQKISETRAVPNTYDVCSWYYDATSYRVDEIIGVWTNSSKTIPYTFSNTDPGCASRTLNVYLSSNGFALDPSVFSQGQTYYIEYLVYATATKGKRSRAYQEDEFIFNSSTLTYQLSKKDGIKSTRSPVVVIDEHNNVYLETTHWTINLNKTDTSIGYPEITFVNGNVMPNGTEFYVKYYYWDHETEGDYVSIDSYTNNDTTSYDYDEVDYKDYVDFRTTSTLKPASENADILVEYQIFLSQFAWLVLNDEGQFKLIRGVSSTQPARTKTPDGVLPLLCMYMPAFSQTPLTMNTTRYRVARDYDVNVLRERVERIEYNLATTVIEQEALSKHTIQPKKGLFTDAFVDNLGMDTNVSTCSIDSRKNRAFIHRSFTGVNLNLSPSEFQDVSLWTSSATIEATETPIDSQLIWTEDFAKEIAGFLFARPQASVECFPKVDIWYSDSAETQVQMHTVEVPSLLAMPVSVDPDSARQLLQDWAKRDASWVLNDEQLDLKPGSLSLAMTTSKQSDFSTISLSTVELLPSIRSRTIVLVIRGCYPYEDGIIAKIDGQTVSLSIATAEDLAACGVQMSPTGTTGALSGTVKANANGIVTAKFTLPTNLTPGQKLIEVRSLADPRLNASAYFFTQGMRREFTNTRTIVQTTEKLYVGAVESKPSETVIIEPPQPPPPPPPPPPVCPSLSIALSNRQFQYELNQALSIPVLLIIRDATVSGWTGQVSLSVESDVLGATVSINPDSVAFGGGTQVVSATISHSAISSSGTYHITIIAQADVGTSCGGTISMEDVLTLVTQPIVQPTPQCPSFHMTGTPGNFQVEQNKSITVPVKLIIRDTNSSGWSGTISLQVTSEVSGSTVSISPDSVQFQPDISTQEFEVAITHSSISSTGNYTVTVSGSANVGTACGGTQAFGSHRVVLDVKETLTVIRCPKLVPSLTPNSILVGVNESINSSVALTVYDAAQSGWSGTVNLSITGQSGSVVPNSFTFTGNNTRVLLTINISAFSSPGRRTATLLLTPVGLHSSCSETQVSARITIRVYTPVPPVVEPAEPTGADFSWVDASVGGGGGDPLCQTFTLKEPRVVSSIDLWFHKVSDQDAPIEIGLRPLTDSGIPDRRQHLARSTLSRAQIMTSMGISDPSQTITTPTLSNRVNFSFPDPVYLPPGDYGFYVGTNVPGYFVFCAKLGKTIMGSLSVSDSSRIGLPLAIQAHDGVLFSSSNNMSWQVELENDLMFRINGLTTGSTDQGRMVLNADGPPNFHEFALLAYAVVPAETAIKGLYSVNSGNWKEFGVTLIDESNQTHDFVNVGAVGTSLKVALDMYTSNSMLTPIVRLEPIQLICLTYDNESIYQTKELQFGGQTFENIEGWVDVLTNGGTVTISASFDHGNTWYTVPTIGTLSLSDGFTEVNFGGSLSDITSGSVTESEYVIIRVTMSSNSSSRWASPQVKRFRFVVY